MSDEPDEALLWAREDAAQQSDRDGEWLYANAYRHGHNDDLLIHEAQAYRAGQAASAERIKALEEALEPFAATGAVLETKPKDDACWAGQRPAPPITFGHLRRAARALLKEADQ